MRTIVIRETHERVFRLTTSELEVTGRSVEDVLLKAMHKKGLDPDDIAGSSFDVGEVIDHLMGPGTPTGQIGSGVQTT